MKCKPYFILVVVLVMLATMSVYIPGATIKMVEAANKGEISQKKLNLTVGKSTELKVRGIKGKVTWKSSNQKIATVSSKGKVKALKAGKATITAKIAKKKFSCKVTISANKKISATQTNTIQTFSSATENTSSINATSLATSSTMSGTIMNELSDKTMVNQDEAVFVTLTLWNKQRDNIVEIILDDSDYGKNQVYTTYASINKIESVDTVYDEETESYYSYVLIRLPKTKSKTIRTVDINEIIYLKKLTAVEGKADMDQALTKKLTMHVSEAPLPSYPQYFNFTRNLDGGYTLVSLSSNYEIPERLYIPSEYEGLPVNKIGPAAFGKTSISHLIIPESILEIGRNMCDGSASFLQSITVLSKTPPQLVSLALDQKQLDGGCTIYVPGESYNLYFNHFDLYNISWGEYGRLLEPMD